MMSLGVDLCSAQSVQQRKTDSMFRLVEKYFNAKQADSIYSLAGEAFRGQISAETFRYVAQNQLFPLGQIQSSSLIRFIDNEEAQYKLVFGSVNLLLRMSLDDKDKLNLFLFQPYKEDVGNKPGPVATTNPMHTPEDMAVDSAVRPYIQKANTAGMSIGIIKKGVTHTYNYGETALGNGHIPTANTIYEIGSVTKTFTSVLLAWYANEGRLKLTDPIVKFLPDSVAANKELQGITLEMLSNHTSGLPRLPTNLENHLSNPLDPYADYDEKDLFEYLKNCKLESKPGERYSYSNLGVGLLGHILERVSGRSFEQMAEGIICRSLGMNSTVQHLTPVLKPRFVKEYNDAGKETSSWNFGVLAPCGAFRSTVHDLLIYAKANLAFNDTKLSKAIQLTHQVTFTEKDLKLGLAWHIIIVNNVPYYFHDGDTYGCSAFLAFNREKNLAVVILSNSGATVNEVGVNIIKKIQ